MEIFWKKTSLRAASIICVVASFALGTSFVNASAENVTADILACINKNTGSVRISKTCAPRETPFQWLINGLTGKQGPRGTQILTGKNIQDLASNTVGDVGDYFLSEGNATLYGPKTIKGWPSVGIKLQGPIGPQGAAGVNGLNGAVGPQGPAGYFQVYDSVGTKLGPLVMGNAYGQWSVLRNGIPIPYSPTFGNVDDDENGYYSLNSNCTGPIYFRMNRVGGESNTSTATSDWLIVRRFSNSDPLFVSRIVLGQRVGTNLMIPVGPSAYVESNVGYWLIPNEENSTTYTCVQTGIPSATYRYFEFKASIHPSPPDGVGPLSIREN